MSGEGMPAPVWEDDLFSLEPCREPPLSGYLILRMKQPAPSAGALDSLAAARLGQVLARAVQAIEEATDADRVYILSFCELDRNLHFHLFPRTAALLEAFRSDGHDGPIDGPRLFVWFRECAQGFLDPLHGTDIATRIRALLDTP